ncbi:MAG: SpoIVB peptidase [Lachnospiraceae bacterium]|nr:SpoIVB peptidase [Lachnospiraceae bacterium]
MIDNSGTVQTKADLSAQGTPCGYMRILSEVWLMKKELWIKRIFVFWLGLTAVFSSLCCFAIQYYSDAVPDTLHVTSGEIQTFDYDLPLTGTIQLKESDADSMVVSLGQTVQLVAENLAEYEMELKLLGIFSVKTVSLEVVDRTYVIPGGIPIGIYIETEGVMVVSVEAVETASGSVSPAEYVLQTGDYILAVNGEAVDSKSDMVSIVEKSGGESLILTVNRNNQVFDTKVTPVRNKEGEYQLGIWIRDNAQGIGTLTYMDELGSFGALGHGIHDSDTGEIVHLEQGSLYETEILAVKKGESGSPGELTGVIEYRADQLLGDIYQNNEYGIFGSCHTALRSRMTQWESLAVGYPEEVDTGAAQIICTVDGERRFYDVEITAVRTDASEQNKALEITVTDPELLELTGGIVQGLSGSPIIQDDKVIGAVTHVFVNAPQKGYGVFLTTMLEQ